MLGARPGLVAGLLVKMEKGDRFSRPEKTGLPECGLRVRQTPPRETHPFRCSVAFCESRHARLKHLQVVSGLGQVTVMLHSRQIEQAASNGWAPAYLTSTNSDS
jgi:hypothetical protein